MNYQQEIQNILKTLAELDKEEMVELLQELAIHNAQSVIDMKNACEDVIEGLEDIRNEI